MIDVDELDSDLLRSLGQTEQAQRFERLERHYLPRADHVTHQRGKRRPRRSPSATGWPPSRLSRTRSRCPAAVPAAEPATDLLFVGNLSYGPNVEGVRWLCESVLPRLPDVTLTIAGSGPGAEVLVLATDARVTVIADPDDVSPLYAGALVAVVPLRQRRGQRPQTDRGARPRSACRCDRRRRARAAMGCG